MAATCMRKKKRKIIVEGMEVRNEFEANAIRQVFQSGARCTYETVKIPFVIKTSYLGDLVCTKRDNNLMIIETKGEFDQDDRKKHRLIKEQHPDWDIRFLFYNANKKIGKRQNSKTYGEWATYYGFKWAHKRIPKEWLRELS